MIHRAFLGLYNFIKYNIMKLCSKTPENTQVM